MNETNPWFVVVKPYIHAMKGASQGMSPSHSQRSCPNVLFPRLYVVCSACRRTDGGVMGKRGRLRQWGLSVTDDDLSLEESQAIARSQTYFTVS